MRKGELITDKARIREILSSSKTIAVVGLSPKPNRDSHRVSRYMQANGYAIIPVRPAQKEILGEPAVSNLYEISVPVDIVNVFRRSDQVLPHAKEALRLKPKVFWMQTGIENEAAAEMLMASGIDVVMDRCIMVDYERLFKNRIA